VAINLNDALVLIASFSTKANTVFAVNNNDEEKSFAAVLATKGKCLSSELTQYIDTICPTAGLSLEAVGHPVELIAASNLSWQPDMYAQLTGELAKWDDDWLLLAHEGGDPIIVKTSETTEGSAEQNTVYSAMQGMGFWDFAPIADSIGQFLVCICAIEHALNFPGLGQPLDDDFNLAPAAANWLFPFLRQHAGTHYDEWAAVFENYQMG